MAKNWRKRQRVRFLVLALGGFSVAIAMMLYGLNDNLLYFRSPTEILADADARTNNVRLGGILVEGSVLHDSKSGLVHFRITDGVSEIQARYAGVPPSLFIEGQSVIAVGRLEADNVFAATQILARHDEYYMPREVADSLGRAMPEQVP